MIRSSSLSEGRNGVPSEFFRSRLELFGSQDLDPLRDFRDFMFLEPRHCSMIGRIDTKLGGDFVIDVHGP